MAVYTASASLAIRDTGAATFPVGSRPTPYVFDDVPPPITGRTATVTTIDELRNAVNGTGALGAISPGDTIYISATSLNGDVTFPSTFRGTNPTNSNRRGVPVIVVVNNMPTNVLGCKVRGTWTIVGSSVWIIGIDFDGNNQVDGVKIKIEGDHVRFMRNRVHKFITVNDPSKGGAIGISVQGKYAQIFYNWFDDWEGRMCSTDTVTGGGGEYAHYFGNIWENNKPPPFANANGRECLQLGQTQVPNGTPCNKSMKAIVDRNLFQNLYIEEIHDENEGISVKSSDNIIRFNTGTDMKSLWNVRFGTNNEVYGNRCTGCQGIGVYGNGHKIHDNDVDTGMIRLGAGNQTMEPGSPQPQYPNGPNNPDSGDQNSTTPWGGKADPDGADYPVCQDCVIDGNVAGSLKIGERASGKPYPYIILRVARTRIGVHAGTILVESAYASGWNGRVHTAMGSSEYRDLGTTYAAARVITASPIIDTLTTSDCGPSCAWVQPPNHPATLP